MTRSSEPEAQSVRSARLRMVRWFLVGSALIGAGVLAWRTYLMTMLGQTAAYAAREGNWGAVERSLDQLSGYRRLSLQDRRLRITAARRRNDVATLARLLGEQGGSDAEIAAARLEQGGLLLDMGRLREAEEAFRLAASSSPASYAPRKALIGILGLERRTADQEEALWNLFKHSLARPEARVEALCLLGRGGPVIPGETLRPGEDEGAALDRALRAEPENAHARAALAYFLRNRGRLDEARAILEPWFREHGDAPPVGDEYLALLLDEGNLEEAGRILDRTEDRPASARRSLLRGVWEASRGRSAEAVNAFRAAIRDDPRDPEPHHRLAQALRSAGHADESDRERAWVEAAQALRQIVGRMDYASPDPAAVARAGELCRTMGRISEADAWRDLLSGPTNPGNVAR